MKRSIHWTLWLAVFTLLALSVSPTLAQLAPKITVNPVWSPTLQLTTLDTNPPGYPSFNPGDDYRYVDATINVTTTVEFWAVELACTANGNVLDTYIWDDDGSDTPDDGWDNQPPVWWIDSTWNGPDGWTNYTSQYTNTAGQLKIAAVATKRGRNLPIGRNGVETTLPLSIIRFRAKPAAGTSPLTCTVSFLDRNGKIVVPATYTAPAPVTVISGYSITGTASYQARTVKNNIGVQCYWNGDPNNPLTPNPVMTNAAGLFTINNLRNWAHVDCVLYGNINEVSPIRAPDVYLSSRFSFNLGEHGSYRELPIELKSGNVNRVPCNPGPNQFQCINIPDDLTTVTLQWNTPNADANGDGKTDKADLAIVAGNINRSEDVDGSHILYSLARSWGAAGRDSHIWVGGRENGAVTALIPGAANTADFWATLSPDGQTIAFVRKTMMANQPAKYELYTAPAAGGAPKLLIAKTAAGNMDAFAPSWSWDSTRIAFVCTPPPVGVEPRGYLVNSGNLCLIDATGRNFRQITGRWLPGGWFAYNAAKIFPPVWEGDWLIFGGTEYADESFDRPPVACVDTLCVYDTRNNDMFPLDSDDVPSPATNEIADMPIMVNGWLFYRFTDPSGNSSLRFIDSLDYDCHAAAPGEPCDWDYVKEHKDYATRGCPGPANTRSQFAHSTVVFDKNTGPACEYEPLDWNEARGAPYDIGYYEMAPYGFEIILKNSSDGLNYRHVSYIWDDGREDDNTGLCADNVGADSDRCWPEWWPLAYFPELIPPDNNWWVDEYQIGSQISDDWWDGNPATPTLLHAERGTMDWQP